MKRTSRILSLIVGIVFVLIGALHTQVHYAELITPEVATIVSGEIPLMGQAAETWRLWQGFSLMMGLCLAAVGLLNIFMVSSLPQEKAMPLGVSCVMIALLGAIAYSGFAFFTPMQLYGGIAGMTLEAGAIVLANFSAKHATPNYGK